MDIIDHLPLTPRTGHLERRLTLPVTSAMRTDFRTVTPNDSLSEFVWGLAFPRKQLEAVVADDDGQFAGVVRLHDARENERDTWVETSVSEVMVTGIEPATLSWTVREVVEAMERADIDIYPVIDPSGRVVGVVTNDAIIKLDELLDDG